MISGLGVKAASFSRNSTGSKSRCVVPSRQDVRLDYAFYVPLHFTAPEPAVPIVPLYVNVYLPPRPTPRRCYVWGRALREILDASPERVALMASGGMSHYPGTDRYASPDFDWDRQMLATLTEGR